MVVLRADPWMPDYGMGFEVSIEEPPALVDPLVETADWSAPRTPPGPPPGEPVSFVDGVRRVELRLVAQDDGARASGLFGSFAVGAVHCDRRANCVEPEVRRYVVVSGGLRAERVEVRTGGSTMVFEPASDPRTHPDAALARLQELMREAEAGLAARLAGGADGLVLLDGPLPLQADADSPVVGVVKRFARRYLDANQEALLARLLPGDRTPLFGLAREGEPRPRYAWYARLVGLRAPWHDHAGLVRCEVRAGVGLEAAVAAADRVTALLPDYAGRPSDPRTPQNLAPVAGLEAWLRHRMGHPGIVRRLLLDWLTGEAA